MKSIFKFSLIPLLLHTLTGHALTVTNIGQGCEASHSLFLKSDGSFWAMGRNFYGQLGDGRLTNTNRPEQIVTNGVTAIAVGGNHSLFLKTNGSFWAMGNNDYGQLGNGPYNQANRPQQIITNGVTAIAAGESHSLFLQSDGSFWAMGKNTYGQLGNGSTRDTNRAEKIVASGVTAIAGGGDHSLLLKSDGSLWTMGNNQAGQLGNSTYSTNLPYGTNQPEQIASGITAIAAGYFHSLFLKYDGSLWVMGNNSNGQLGDGFIGNKSLSDGTSIPEQIFPLTQQPVLSSTLLSTSNLQFKATCGFGGNFRLLSSTNINTLLSQWTPVRTNSVTARGANNFSFTLTNAVNSGGRRFYILQSQ